MTSRLEPLDAQARTYELVLNRLRDAIVGGTLRPGEQIKTEDIAKDLGVSRMPVREALHRLEVEGLVVMRPYRGIVVAPLTAEGVRHAYELMAVIEGLAARKAAEYIPDKTLDDLAILLGQMDEARRLGDYPAYSVLNHKFHSEIYGWYRSDRAHEIIHNLWNYVYRLRSAYPPSQARLLEAATEHRAVVEALRKRDGILAEQLVRRHNERSLAELVSLIQADPVKVADREREAEL